jgi:hypothetical protein
MRCHIGNAARDGAEQRHWFVGHFLGAEHGIRASDEVEIKWALHPAGERRPQAVTGETRTTALILVSGRYRIALSTGSHVLSEPGDYAMWGPGVDHTWEAIEDSTVITVRWPSAAADGGLGDPGGSRPSG